MMVNIKMGQKTQEELYRELEVEQSQAIKSRYLENQKSRCMENQNRGVWKTRSRGISKSRSRGIQKTRKLGISKTRCRSISKTRSRGISKTRSRGISRTRGLSISKVELFNCRISHYFLKVKVADLCYALFNYNLNQPSGFLNSGVPVYP